MADDLMMMFQSITTADHDELVDQFAHLLELDTHTATFFLESSNWNVETAVNNYLATMEPALFHQQQQQRYQQQQQQDGEDLAMDDDEEDEDLGGSHHHHGATPTAYDAQFVTDLSAAQSALVPPSTAVDMQWSFVNSGATPWPSDTHLVFAQGDSLDGPLQVPVAAVAPGARIDLAVRLRTPPNAGPCSGSWRLVSSQGPIGEPMWLVLNVGGAPASKHEAFEPAAASSGLVAGVGAAGSAAGPSTVGGGASVFSNNDEDMMDL